MRASELGRFATRDQPAAGVAEESARVVAQWGDYAGISSRAGAQPERAERLLSGQLPTNCPYAVVPVAWKVLFAAYRQPAVRVTAIRTIRTPWNSSVLT